MDVDEQIDAFDDPESLEPVYAGPQLDPDRDEVAAKPAPLGVALDDPVLEPSIALARQALEEITSPEDLGELAGIVDEGDGVYSLQFAMLRPGYPDWRWTASLIHLVDEDAPTVLETELLPGETSLLAPSWRPWAERLAEFEEAAAEREAAEAAAADDADGEGAENAERPARRVQRIERTRRRRRTRNGEVIIEDSAAPKPLAEDEANDASAQTKQDEPNVVSEKPRAEREARPEPSSEKQARETSEHAAPVTEPQPVEPGEETPSAKPSTRRRRRRVVVDPVND